MPRCAADRQTAEAKVHEDLDPSEVLNYVLLNGVNNLGTVRAFLSQQDWYIAAQSTLTDKAKFADTAAGLCRRIRNEITGLGLNGFDSEIVVWAVVNGMPLPSGVDFAQAPDCMKPIETIAAHRKAAADRLVRREHGVFNGTESAEFTAAPYLAK